MANQPLRVLNSIFGYDRFSGQQQHFPHIPRIALTATADEKTRVEIINNLVLDQANIHLVKIVIPVLNLLKLGMQPLPLNNCYLVFIEQENMIKPIFELFEEHYNYGILRCIRAALPLTDENQ